MPPLHHHDPKPTPTNQNPTPTPSDPITNHPTTQINPDQANLHKPRLTHHHRPPQNHQPRPMPLPLNTDLNPQCRHQSHSQIKHSIFLNPPNSNPISLNPRYDLTMPCLCRKKHHHCDLATSRSTTNRQPLHTERNREWKTERQSGNEGERIERGERTKKHIK